MPININLIQIFMQVTKVQSIFKSKHFPSLLRIWNFARQWRAQIDLPQKYQMISLYEMQASIHEDKIFSKYINILIQKLLLKVNLKLNSSSITDTLFGICFFNRYCNFNQHVKTSAFQLGHSLVNHFLSKQGELSLQQVLSFEMLNISSKYRYLTILINYVQAGFIEKAQQDLFQKFENDQKKINEKFNNQTQAQLSQNNKFCYTKKHHDLVKIKKNQLKTLQTTYFKNSVQFFLLGIIDKKQIYMFCQHIPDRVLILNSQTNQWSSIIGKQNLKIKILELLQNGDELNSQQLDLLENLDIVLSDIRQEPLKSVFLPFNDKIQQQARSNKLYLIKEYFKNMEEKYSEFLSQCFNGRWADKQSRKLLRASIEQSKTIFDILTVFKEFYNKTNNKYFKSRQRQLNYDYKLQNPESNAQFQCVALTNINYLYSKNLSKQFNYSYNLYRILRTFLAISQKTLYHAEFLLMSLKSMLGVIKNLYPQCHKKRLAQLEKEKQKKNQQEIKKTTKNLQQQKKWIKETMQSKYGVHDSSEQEQQNSDKTEIKKGQAHSGRRLRLKAKVDYFSSTNSRKEQNKLNFRSSRNTNQSSEPSEKKNKKKQKNKMNMDSDQQDQYTSYDSDAQTNLQKFEFKHAGGKRQGLRSKDKK